MARGKYYSASHNGRPDWSFPGAMTQKFDIGKVFYPRAFFCKVTYSSRTGANFVNATAGYTGIMPRPVRPFYTNSNGFNIKTSAVDQYTKLFTSQSGFGATFCRPLWHKTIFVLRTYANYPGAPGSGRVWDAADLLQGDGTGLTAITYQNAVDQVSTVKYLRKRVRLFDQRKGSVQVMKFYSDYRTLHKHWRPYEEAAGDRWFAPNDLNLGSTFLYFNHILGYQFPQAQAAPNNVEAELEVYTSFMLECHQPFAGLINP